MDAFTRQRLEGNSAKSFNANESAISLTEIKLTAEQACQIYLQFIISSVTLLSGDYRVLSTPSRPHERSRAAAVSAKCGAAT